jgi:hypothetical protein
MILDDFFFDSSKNHLTLFSGSLSYVPNRQYEIYVSTIHLSIEYYQKVIINIQASAQAPIPVIT